MTTKNPTSQSAPNHGTPSSSATEQQLKQTEIGEFIANNKPLVFGLFIAIIVGVIGYGVLEQQKQKTKEHNAKLIYEFRENSLEKFRSDELKVDGFLNQYNQLATTLKGSESLLPMAMEVTDLLEEKDLAGRSLEVLNKVKKVSNPYSEIVFGLKKSQLIADSKDYQKALEVLNDISPQAAKLLPEQYFLSKGRYQMLTNQNDKAIESFKNVTKETGQEEFVKLANIYLEQLGVDPHQGSNKTGSTQQPIDTSKMKPLGR